MVRTDNNHEALDYCNCIKCRRSRGELVREKVVTTNRPISSQAKKRILTTHDLPVIDLSKIETEKEKKE